MLQNPKSKNSRQEQRSLKKETVATLDHFLQRFSMDHHEEDDALLSSQIVEEEDLLFDDGPSEQLLLDATEGNGDHDNTTAQQSDMDETLRVRLAGPSTGKVNHCALQKAIPLIWFT